jgi:hypothetical protein
MTEVLQPADVQAESKRMREQVRWENWGREIGLLTREQIQHAVHPDWQWGDYEI